MIMSVMPRPSVANEANPSELWLHEVYQDEAAFVAHGHNPVVRGLADRIAR